MKKKLAFLVIFSRNTFKSCTPCPVTKLENCPMSSGIVYPQKHLCSVSSLTSEF
jgi:hypothetical protein